MVDTTKLTQHQMLAKPRLVGNVQEWLHALDRGPNTMRSRHVISQWRLHTYTVYNIYRNMFHHMLCDTNNTDR